MSIALMVQFFWVFFTVSTLPFVSPSLFRPNARMQWYANPECYRDVVTILDYAVKTVIRLLLVGILYLLFTTICIDAWAHFSAISSGALKPNVSIAFNHSLNALSLSLNNFAFCCSPQWPEEPRAWNEQREWFSILTRLRGYAHDWIHKWNVLTPFRVNLHAWVWVIVFSSDWFFTTSSSSFSSSFRTKYSINALHNNKSAYDASMCTIRLRWKLFAVRTWYIVQCTAH